jgi:mannose-6-phosphate isomerase-like protein (cupin superfamily)
MFSAGYKGVPVSIAIHFRRRSRTFSVSGSLPHRGVPAVETTIATIGTKSSCSKVFAITLPEPNHTNNQQKRQANVKKSKKSSKGLLIGRETESEWSEVTPGERFSIRVSSEDTNGAYTMLEVLADHRNGTPMHVHQNEDEHFIILEGTAHLAYGGKTVDASAGTNITVSKGIHHAWCNLSKSPLRMLALFTPGGIDELFRTTARGDDINITAYLDKFGTRLVGPALFNNIYTRFSPRP